MQLCLSHIYVECKATWLGRWICAINNGLLKVVCVWLVPNTSPPLWTISGWNSGSNNEFLSSPKRPERLWRPLTGTLSRRYSDRGVKLTSHPHVMSRLRTRGATYPLSSYTFMVCWDNFTCCNLQCPTCKQMETVIHLFINQFLKTQFLYSISLSLDSARFGANSLRHPQASSLLNWLINNWI
jgi:hypothetical protein